MGTERWAPDDPREWLKRAESNLMRAKADIALEGVYLEDLCFDTQQAAEKAIKAVFLFRNIRFPHVHDLTQLLSMLAQNGEPISDAVKEAGRLTRFAVATRYPGLSEPVTQEEYHQAIVIAETVFAWAEICIEGKHRSPGGLSN